MITMEAKLDRNSLSGFHNVDDWRVIYRLEETSEVEVHIVRDTIRSSTAKLIGNADCNSVCPKGCICVQWSGAGRAADNTSYGTTAITRDHGAGAWSV